MLDDPRRLSTDIDIVVAPGTDMDTYIEKAGTIFLFCGYTKITGKAQTI